MNVLQWIGVGCVVVFGVSFLALVYISARLRADRDFEAELRDLEPMTREEFDRQRELWRRVRKAIRCRNRRRHEVDWS